jgi:hypothetical protein
LASHVVRSCPITGSTALAVCRFNPLRPPAGGSEFGNYTHRPGITRTQELRSNRLPQTIDGTTYFWEFQESDLVPYCCAAA